LGRLEDVGAGRGFFKGLADWDVLAAMLGGV